MTEQDYILGVTVFSKAGRHAHYGGDDTLQER